jgi:hypothetical protein
MKVSLQVFSTVVRSGIRLTVGRDAIVDLTLRLGEISDQITAESSEFRSAAESGVQHDRDHPRRCRRITTTSTAARQIQLGIKAVW